MATLAVTNDFSAGAAIVASEMNTNFSDVETFINSTPGVLQLTGGTVTGAVTLSNTLTVGANDTGYDVKLFGATTGKSWLWDEDADKMIVTGTTTLAGATQQTGTLTVGVNDTGYDVKFFGATDTAYMLWDEDADELIVDGAGTGGSSGGLTVQTTVTDGAAHVQIANDAQAWKWLVNGSISDAMVLRDQTGGVNRFLFHHAGTHTADLFVGQTSTYSIGGSSDGNTFINAANTKGTYHRINNATEMLVNGTGVSIGGGDSGPNNTLDVIGDLFVGDTSRTYAGNSQYGGLCFPRGEIFFSNTNAQNQLFLLSNMTMGGDGSLDAINTAVCAYAALDNGTFLVKTAASTTAGAAPSLTTRLIISNAGAVTIAGALSKGSGTFDIPHPTRGGDWRLRHSFIEGPQADLIYRGTATLSGGTVTIDLDTASNMTDGTWEALNRDPWAMVASSGNAVEWSLSGKTLTITSDTADAVCSWMVIGERQDDHMKSAEGVLADDDGHLIVEYEQEDTSEANEAAAFEAGEALAEANAEAAAVAAEEAAAALAEANAEAAAAAA